MTAIIEVGRLWNGGGSVHSPSWWHVVTAADTTLYLNLDGDDVDTVHLWDMVGEDALLVDDLDAAVGNAHLVFNDKRHEAAVEAMHERDGCQDLARYNNVAYRVRRCRAH